MALKTGTSTALENASSSVTPNLKAAVTSTGKENGSATVTANLLAAATSTARENASSVVKPGILVPVTSTGLTRGERPHLMPGPVPTLDPPEPSSGGFQ